ncbi:peptidoglycan-binding protein [Streptomyces sp. NPDC047072]|uniref:peptidoglycan-binding protein n=1 Tax=Streptomyces sp. NPDC047072 TaxID=3154809 RepID=UPI0033D66E31
MLTLGASAWGITAGGGSAGGAARPLLGGACKGTVSIGQRGSCVREVQRLLAKAGAKLGVDGEFGPETLRRVTAFQVLSRIPVTGTVGEQTKKALYAPKIRMDTWSQDQVRRRIREVFTETPDLAVAIADCQSFLDPLHILPNTDGTRNWGVFQISDATLRSLDGTPLDALDPEWNIQAAHRLWSRAQNFDDWPNCERAAAPRTTGPSLLPAPTDGTRPAAPDPSPTPTPSPAAANCPAPGQRFSMPGEDRVYLVGPGSRLYYVPDQTVYFNLWADWNGVAAIDGDIFGKCGWTEARELADAHLARTSGDSPTYIWDAWYGYRRIPSRAALNTYAFATSKIQTRSSLTPVDSKHPWG